jgi:hypothetical protein
VFSDASSQWKSIRNKVRETVKRKEGNDWKGIKRTREKGNQRNQRRRRWREE